MPAGSKLSNTAGPVAPAGDGVIGKGELDQPDLAQRLGQVARELLHRRQMITRERADGLLVLLGLVGSQEDPDPQLPGSISGSSP